MLSLVLYMCELSYLGEPGKGYVTSEELTGRSLLADVSSYRHTSDGILYRELLGSYSPRLYFHLNL